jgi:hypothetical protein
MRGLPITVTIRIVAPTSGDGKGISAPRKSGVKSTASTQKRLGLPVRCFGSIRVYPLGIYAAVNALY